MNHCGCSDSLGVIAVHLFGILYGPTTITERSLEEMELRRVIEKVTEDIERVGSPVIIRGIAGLMQTSMQNIYGAEHADTTSAVHLRVRRLWLETNGCAQE